MADMRISIQDYYSENREKCSCCEEKSYYIVRVGFLSYEYVRPNGRYCCSKATCLTNTMKKMRTRNSPEMKYVQYHK